MKDRDYKPLAMWGCLVTGILVAAIRRYVWMPSIWNQNIVTWDFVFIGLYVLWMLLEWRVSREDVNTEGKKTSDSGTCALYGFGQALTALTALWFPSVWRAPGVAHAIGISAFLVGVSYRLWAIRTLGQLYSHRIQIGAQHRIIDSGPYHFTRHPAYAGMIIANAAITTYFFNWVTLGVFLFVLTPAILLRIRLEERTLSRLEGYSEFAQRRKRLAPGLW